MSIEVAWEKLDDLLADGLDELSIGHWEEAENDHLPLEIDWPGARVLERQGTFKIAGVRKNGVLIGYAYFIISASLQHKGTLQAWCEAIYVDADHRGAGVVLLRALPRMLKALGVRRAFMAAKPHVALRIGEKGATLGDLLVALRWSLFETVYAIRLKG
jgi:GNAT superfamily N-acetyltransferase